MRSNLSDAMDCFQNETCVSMHGWMDAARLHIFEYFSIRTPNDERDRRENNNHTHAESTRRETKPNICIRLRCAFCSLSIPIPLCLRLIIMISSFCSQYVPFSAFNVHLHVKFKFKFVYIVLWCIRNYLRVCVCCLRCTRYGDGNEKWHDTTVLIVVLFAVAAITRCIDILVVLICSGKYLNWISQNGLPHSHHDS